METARQLKETLDSASQKKKKNYQIPRFSVISRDQAIETLAAMATDGDMDAKDFLRVVCEAKDK